MQKSHKSLTIVLALAMSLTACGGASMSPEVRAFMDDRNAAIALKPGSPAEEVEAAKSACWIMDNSAGKLDALVGIFALDKTLQDNLSSIDSAKLIQVMSRHFCPAYEYDAGRLVKLRVEGE